MKSSHREVVAALRRGGMLRQFGRGWVELADRRGRLIRRVRVFTVWDMSNAGLIRHRWIQDEGDCEDGEYRLADTSWTDGREND